MDIKLSTQLAQAAISVLWGAGLGLYYDFLRLPRLLFPGRVSTAVCDMFFCFGALLGLFILGLGPGEGQLRLFMCLFTLAGFVLWRLAPGHFLRAAEHTFAAALKHSAQIVAAKARIALHKLKKCAFFQKKSLQTEEDGLQ